MLTNAFLRKMRLSGLVLFFGNTFLQLAYSALIAFDIFRLLGVPWLEEDLFNVLASIMALGFLLMFLGGVLQRKVKKPEVDVAKLGDSAAFYEQQKEYAEPDLDASYKGKGTKRYFLLVMLVIVATSIAFIIYDKTQGVVSTVFFTVYQGLLQYSVALGIIAVAFLVALIVGNVNEDVWRLYIRGYHVHESIIGIYFTFIGAPLLFTSGLSPVPFYIGLAYITAGVFLVGRDWRDVVRGYLLVHKSNEPDYDEYMALKGKRGAIFNA